MRIQKLDGYLKEDSRGFAFCPTNWNEANLSFQGDLPHIVTMNPGALRGNHVHLESEEEIFCWGTTLSVYWKEDRQVKSATLEKEYVYKLSIPKNVPHTFYNPSSKIGFLFSYFRDMATPYLEQTQGVPIYTPSSS